MSFDQKCVKNTRNELRKCDDVNIMKRQLLSITCKNLAMLVMNALLFSLLVLYSMVKVFFWNAAVIVKNPTRVLELGSGEVKLRSHHC